MWLVSSKSLTVAGICTCVLQLLITWGIPLWAYFVVYKLDSRLLYVPITTWGMATLAGALGLAGILARQGLLMSLHAVMALVLSACLGIFNTQFYLDMATRCNMLQVAFTGCSACACAAGNSCTSAQISAGCPSCPVVGRDVCSSFSGWESILPWIGIIEALATALPVLFSIMLLTRTESEVMVIIRGLASNRRQMESELRRLEEGLELELPAPRRHAALASLSYYGNRSDRGLVGRLEALLGGQDASEIAAAQQLLESSDRDNDKLVVGGGGNRKAAVAVRAWDQDQEAAGAAGGRQKTRQSRQTQEREARAAEEQEGYGQQEQQLLQQQGDDGYDEQQGYGEGDSGQQASWQETEVYDDGEQQAIEPVVVTKSKSKKSKSKNAVADEATLLAERAASSEEPEDGSSTKKKSSKKK